MDIATFKKILDEYKRSVTTAEQAAEKLNSLNLGRMRDICIDNWRGLRTGFPEVIFGSGKTDKQIINIVEKMIAQNTVILITRVYEGLEEKLSSVTKKYPFQRKSTHYYDIKTRKLQRQSRCNNCRHGRYSRC